MYEEVKKAVEKDRSMVKVSELSKHGLMEMTRKRVCTLLTQKKTTFFPYLLEIENYLEYLLQDRRPRLYAISID